MGELINGRTQEEIKYGLRCGTTGEHECSTCAYYGRINEENGLREFDCGKIDGDALALIERLESERDAALAKVPKWISVEERLPEHRQRAYARAKDGFCFEGVYIDPVGFERYEIGEGWINENKSVTHWMPLPEPPKEGE